MQNIAQSNASWVKYPKPSKFASNEHSPVFNVHVGDLIINVSAMFVLCFFKS